MFHVLRPFFGKEFVFFQAADILSMLIKTTLWLIFLYCKICCNLLEKVFRFVIVGKKQQ